MISPILLLLIITFGWHFIASEKLIRHFEKSIQIGLKTLGDHPYTASSYNNIGMAFYNNRDIDKA